FFPNIANMPNIIQPRNVLSQSMGKTSLQTIASLEQQIAAGKQKLQEAFDTCGCTDSIVLAYSIKLDKLINRYQRMKSKEKN
ncbi:MAG TPA: hypothetical protein DDW50_12705, partial [Firmicutes bacterium]|nr:hypothetical protein [Bacillota bacterium]